MWYNVRMNETGMAELAYATDLKSVDLLDLVGSSPTLGIEMNNND